MHFAPIASPHGPFICYRKILCAIFALLGGLSPVLSYATKSQTLRITLNIASGVSIEEFSPQMDVILTPAQIASEGITLKQAFKISDNNHFIQLQMQKKSLDSKNPDNKNMHFNQSYSLPYSIHIEPCGSNKPQDAKILNHPDQNPQIGFSQIDQYLQGESCTTHPAELVIKTKPAIVPEASHGQAEINMLVKAV